MVMVMVMVMVMAVAAVVVVGSTCYTSQQKCIKNNGRKIGKDDADDDDYDEDKPR